MCLPGSGIDSNAIPELANTSVGAIVESVNTVPVVVESETYWTVKSVSREAGATTPATRLGRTRPAGRGACVQCGGITRR